MQYLMYRKRFSVDKKRIITPYPVSHQHVQCILEEALELLLCMYHFPFQYNITNKKDSCFTTNHCIVYPPRTVTLELGTKRNGLTFSEVCVHRPYRMQCKGICLYKRKNRLHPASQLKEITGDRHHQTVKNDFNERETAKGGIKWHQIFDDYDSLFEALKET